MSKKRIAAIRTLLEQYLYPPSSPHMTTEERLDTTAEAIAALPADKPELTVSAADGGEWRAFTLGGFVGLLVDDAAPAVLFRVVHESEDDARGAYRCTYEVITLPQGQVVDAINEKVPLGMNPVLNALIDAGIVK